VEPALVTPLGDTSTLGRFGLALRPSTGAELLAAGVLGQAIGIAATGRIAVLPAVLGLVFALLHLLCVGLLETWGDREVDALRRRIDPDGEEPCTIADGWLESRSVLWAGLGVGAFALSVAVVAEIAADRPGATMAAALALVPVLVGSLPPLRLRERGGGELLEMIGIGFAVPWWHAYVQSGIAVPTQLAFLPGFALLALAAALARGLVDEDAQRLAGRRTFVAMFGGAAVRSAIEGLVIGAMLVWVAMPRLAPLVAAWWTCAPAVLVMAWLQREVGTAGRAADVDAVVGSRRYHEAVYRTIVLGATALALTLVVASWLVPRTAFA